ncbi:MAG: hypothetical protein ACNS60_19920 [Candidatus Cyclobacteriaceae bacterium M2_1C_046]
MNQNPFQVRPRFKAESPFTVSELEEKVQVALQESKNVKGHFISGHIVLHLPAEQQNYWSPQLNITLENKEKGTTVRGYYAPRPQVWTMFVLFYAIIGFAVLFISLYGFSLYSLGKPATILWLVPVFLLIFLTLYFVAYSGQKMSRPQMINLQDFTENVVGVKVY